MTPAASPGPEQRRLHEADTTRPGWRRWGPYLSDRQWGTVREDYSADGDAWAYLTHDQARSRAYRWGEDGIAGFSDDEAIDWLLAPDETIRSAPLAALRAGRKSEVRRVAQTLA